MHGAKDRAPGARSCPLLNVFILTLACLVCDVPGVQRHSCCFHAYQGHGQPLEVGPVRSRACSLAASVLRAASPCCQGHPAGLHVQGSSHPGPQARGLCALENWGAHPCLPATFTPELGAPRCPAPVLGATLSPKHCWELPVLRGGGAVT